MYTPEQADAAIGCLDPWWGEAGLLLEEPQRPAEGVASICNTARRLSKAPLTGPDGAQHLRGLDRRGELCLQHPLTGDDEVAVGLGELLGREV